MATEEQQVAFIATWLPYAESAAAQMKTNPILSLAQWALESAWGTASYVDATNNVGGIMNGSAIMNFANKSDFVAVYVRSMTNDCPNIREGKTNANSDAAFTFANTRYNTVNPKYAQEIQSIMGEIDTLRSTTPAQAHDNTSRPVLRLTEPNMTGQTVKDAQTKLNEHGVTPQLTLDGIFGPKTEAAVKQFQKDHSLNETGIVDAHTWAALDATPTPQAATKPADKVPAAAPAAQTAPATTKAAQPTEPVPTVQHNGFTYPKFIIPTDKQLAHADTEVEAEQLGIKVLQAMGATNAQIENYLENWFGYAKSIAVSEANQNYPVEQQTPGEYKKIKSVYIHTTDGKNEERTDIDGMLVNYQDGSSENIG